MTRHSLIIALLLCAVNLFSGAPALAASNLKSIHRTDESAYMQFFLHFDRLPVSTTATSGRRVDLTLEKTAIDASVEPPKVDSRMIKMTRTQKDGNTVLSFYFRYPPQKVTLKDSKETGMLMVDVLLGNPVAARYPELAAQLRGVTVLNRAQTDSLHPRNSSAFAKDWKKAFTAYEGLVVIDPPPKLLRPPFPLAAALQPPLPQEQWLTAELLAAAGENKWNQVSQMARKLLTEQPDERLKERLVLTYAEALFRSGEYEEPYALLQRIALEYPDTLMADLANYLFINLQAVRGDAFSASYDLDNLAPKLAGTPFTAHTDMLSAELALASGRINEAEKALNREAVIRDDSLRLLRSMRQADILVAKKEPAKALTLYEGIARQSPAVDADPLSLANFAGLLYAAKRYEEAARKYQQLADLLDNEQLKGLALFRLALCHLPAQATARKARIELMQVQDAFPRDQAGMRARMKLTDLDYAAGKMKPESALAVYAELANEGSNVPLREEAWFKQALVQALTGRQRESVQLLVDMLRLFQSGPLRVEATALLIEQLPGVLKQLVAAKEYIQALVLAKQNRELFARGWLAPGLLFDLAKAYNQLGLVEQAAQTYQYLFEVSADGDRETIYLPLIQALFASGQHVQVEEFANRYSLRYPQGGDSQTVFYYKVQSLYASGQLDKALSLLHSDEASRTPRVDILKARIFFDQKQWPQVIEVLEQPALGDQAAAGDLPLLLAESYFQTARDDKARPLFARLADKDDGGEQARFRLAQIEQRGNNRAQALKLYTELAEKGTDSPWTRLAREEAAILQLQKN